MKIPRRSLCGPITPQYYAQFIRQHSYLLRPAENGCVEWLGAYQNGKPTKMHVQVRHIVWNRYNPDNPVTPRDVVFVRCCNDKCVAKAHILMVTKTSYTNIRKELSYLWWLECQTRKESQENAAGAPQ